MYYILCIMSYIYIFSLLGGFTSAISPLLADAFWQLFTPSPVIGFTIVIVLPLMGLQEIFK